jgi:hypothetical protein
MEDNIKMDFRDINCEDVNWTAIVTIANISY